MQAAIAACHATAPDAAATDWAQIARALRRAGAPGARRRWSSSNRAVAVAMADGPEAGLALVDDAGRAGELAGYHLLPATRADLLRRLGRHEEAAEAYRQALALAVHRCRAPLPGPPAGRGGRRASLTRGVLAALSTASRTARSERGRTLAVG